MPENRLEHDEFYVGYFPPPPLVLRVARIVVGVLMVASGLIAGFLAPSHDDPGTGQWADGKAIAFTGVVTLDPYPIIHLDKQCGEVPAGSSLLIVEMGKFGAQRRCEPAAGHHATLSGFLLRREGRVMVELEPGSNAVSIGPASDAVPVETAGVTTEIDGEIVDAKCWLGAMKPGDGRVHRECAMRCVSAGIPPMLVSRTPGADPTYTLVVPADGPRLSPHDCSMIGLPVHVRGRLSMIGGVRLLRLENDAVAPWTTMDPTTALTQAPNTRDHP